MTVDKRKDVCRALLKWYQQSTYLTDAATEAGKKRRELDILLKSLSEKLPDREHELIEYYYLEGNSAASSMAMMGIRESAFYGHQRRAILMLSNVITDDQLGDWGRWLDDWNR